VSLNASSRCDLWLLWIYARSLHLYIADL